MTLLELIYSDLDLLLNRDFIIDCFSESTIEDIADVAVKDRYVGKIVKVVNKICYLSDKGNLEQYEEINVPKQQPYLNFTDRVQLPAGVIVNHTKGSIKTSLGRILLNYCALCKPFGDKIPFTNGRWNSKEIEDAIIKLALDDKATTQDIYDYADNLYFLTTYTDFCVPALSERAITIAPEVFKRRDELFKQYRNQLDDPKIMMLIENELIALDKKSLEGDVSNDFMISGKNYDVHRKRMFLTLGMVQSFGQDKDGFEFMEANLDSGWEVEDFAAMSNDIRRGSYDRGKSTALGGVESKYLGRTFQESKIVEGDCKTKKGLVIEINEANHKLFTNRNAVIGTKVIPITEENIKSYIGKTITIRSPMLCKSDGGYCYKCMDTRFEKIGIKLLNTLPINIGSAFLLDSMKSMHGTKLQLFNIESLNEFTI